MSGQFAAARDNHACQQFDGTRIRQAATDDQNQRDNDGGWMSKPGKSQLFRYHTSEQCSKESHERDHVITPSPPYQEYEYKKQQGKQGDLVRSQRNFLEMIFLIIVQRAFRR